VKRKNYADQHKTEWSDKSLATRVSTGTTKSSQIQGSKTRIANGHYIKLAERMRELYAQEPWYQRLKCKHNIHASVDLLYQGQHEYRFLEQCIKQNGEDWVKQNIRRGPGIRYHDTILNKQRLYLPDFIDTSTNTIYEVKSSYTWNRSIVTNKDKLNACIKEGYNVVLVLDNKHINYEQ
jgi:hypothetical protein